MSAAKGPEQVVLVDGADRPLGEAEKLEAHRAEGKLHRAISVLLFDRKGRTLLQRRAEGKYHSPSTWANTCCSHPRPGEPVLDAGRRRLREELGIDCPLREAFAFTYSVDVGSGLTEREYDHVLVGRYDGEVRPDPSEVSEYRWATLPELYREVRADDRSFAPWFRILLVEMAQHPPFPESLPTDRE